MSKGLGGNIGCRDKTSSVVSLLYREGGHRKKRIPPLSRKLVFFANRNTPKNMQLLDKIHTVFTAALRMSRLARDGTTEPVSRDQMARMGKEKTNIFPVQLITSWIDNLTRLIYSLYTHVHKTAVCSVKSGNKWTEPTLRARSFCYTKSCTNIASERGSVAPLNLSVMSAPGTMVTHTFRLARV